MSTHIFDGLLGGTHMRPKSFVDLVKCRRSLELAPVALARAMLWLILLLQIAEFAATVVGSHQKFGSSKLRGSPKLTHLAEQR